MFDENKERDEAPITQGTCRCCGELKDRVFYKGKYYNLKRQRWNGRMCPECNVEFTRRNMNKLRNERKEDYSDEWLKIGG